MTATNMCSNFGGFQCSPPLRYTRDIILLVRLAQKILTLGGWGKGRLTMYVACL